MIDRNTKETYQFAAKKEDIRKKWMDAMKMAQSVTLCCENNKLFTVVCCRDVLSVIILVIIG